MCADRIGEARQGLTQNKRYPAKQHAASALFWARLRHDDALFWGTRPVRVLALASQKGGSGKTTLSGHLSVQAQRAGAGPVVLIDIDPQGSLADWWNERE